MRGNIYTFDGFASSTTDLIARFAGRFIPLARDSAVQRARAGWHDRQWVVTSASDSARRCDFPGACYARTARYHRSRLPAHVTAKWTPVRRWGHAPTPEAAALPRHIGWL